MNMSVDGAFIYFTIPILGGINITQTTVSHLIWANDSPSGPMVCRLWWKRVL